MRASQHNHLSRAQRLCVALYMDCGPLEAVLDRCYALSFTQSRPQPTPSTIADCSRAVTRHIQEIELIRGKVYTLDQQHQQMKAK